MSVDDPDDGDAFVENLGADPDKTALPISPPTPTATVTATPSTNPTTPTVSALKEFAAAATDLSSTVEKGQRGPKKVDFSNSVFVAILAVAAWVFIAGLNMVRPLSIT